ncbi:MAG: DUF4190 domain-containing protein [Salinibacterium sp.]|nr:DUF4190 domain-containing protein [Salinibacterium sp.]
MSDATPIPPVPDPYAAGTPANAYSAPPAARPADGKTLGIVALILAFVAQLLGLILGIVARNQSKRAGVKNTPATVAIVLSIVLMVLGLIIAVPLIIGGGALLGQCAEYGPGVHELDNGVTLTCG